MSGIWPKESAKCNQLIDISSKFESIEDKVHKTIESHLFSQNIQLISSDSRLTSLIEDYIRSNESLSYYLVKNVPIYLFINKILINGFVKTGRLFCHSINREIDFDDCFALLPNGIIVLSVKESTYYRLGIVGKKSILYKKKNCIQKYLIKIDLNDKNFIPGTKLYQKTEECLQKSGLCFDVFLKWEVISDELINQSIASMSIQNFFSYIKSNSSDNCLDSLQWFRCLPSLKSFSNNYIPIPLIIEEFLLEDIQTLIEWFGAQMCQIDCHSNEDSDVSTFGINLFDERQDIHCISLNGFFIPSDIKKLFDYLKTKLVDSCLKDMNAIIINGFEDSVVSWKGTNNEHSKNTSGENLFGIGFHKHLSFIWRTADEYDFGIERL